MDLGTFTRDGDKFTGTITTLAFKAKAIVQPIDKVSAFSPDFRIYASGAEIGAAWTMTSKSGRPYLSIKLDDPSFSGAIYCRLVEVENERHSLIWSR